MPKTPPYFIKCNFKEKLIEIDISRFFGGFRDRLMIPYFLTDSKEQRTGADLESIDSHVLAIYMQVKVSEGLKTITKHASSNRKNRSYLEDIREYRHKLELDYSDDYFLFFPLRKKAPTAFDFQHNILMDYANTGYSHAFYVAPLSITKVEYEQSLFDPNNYRFNSPFHIGYYRLIENSWISYFGFLPFLRNHISIIPHVRVSTAEHFYAFSKDGIDVTWHSPQFIDSQPSRLSDRMEYLFNVFTRSKENITVRELAYQISQKPIMKNADFNSENPLQTIAKHAEILESQYGIKQFLFIK